MTDEEKQALPGYAQLKQLAVEIATKMASNQAEVWLRIFYRIGISGPPEWCVRCIWLQEAIDRLLPVTIGRERIERPVSNEEAYTLGYTGSKMSAAACVSLACVLYQLERELGSDHQAIQPVRWERRGVLQRARDLSRTKVEEGTWGS